MFNLEQAIAEWCRQMLGAGLKSPVPLDELESHLRDDIEQKIRSGLSAQEAFALAIRQVGGADALKIEFKKIHLIKRETRKQTMIILVAIYATEFGGAIFWAALGQRHYKGILIWCPLMIGPALVLLAGGIVLYGLKRHRSARARTWIRSALMMACGFYMVPLIDACLFQKVDLPGRIFYAFLAVASAVFFGACYRRSRNSSAIRTREK